MKEILNYNKDGSLKTKITSISQSLVYCEILKNGEYVAQTNSVKCKIMHTLYKNNKHIFDIEYFIPIKVSQSTRLKLKKEIPVRRYEPNN